MNIYKCNIRTVSVGGPSEMNYIQNYKECWHTKDKRKTRSDDIYTTGIKN